MKTVNLGGYEWYVLEEQDDDDKVLLLSKDIITKQPYHYKYERTSLEKCSLRKWLNSDFYESLKEGHANILDTETEQGVTDKIFLLSIEEYEKYNIKYNIPPAEGWWWLRSLGFGGYGAKGVCDFGSAFVYVHSVDYDSGGVRPAMWVDTTEL
ncbi:MAG: DUF6273 domain-containing protein [Defluviitaleaceae bacterium]|nr:DUF6273 domain-containing protein [Defluviitaleaceae bacterium]